MRLVTLYQILKPAYSGFFIAYLICKSKAEAILTLALYSLFTYLDYTISLFSSKFLNILYSTSEGHFQCHSDIQLN